MKKELFNVFVYVIHFLIALLGWGEHQAIAQNRIDVTLKYNTTSSLYEVYARPNFTDPAFGIGAGTQLSIVVPASVADSPLAITSANGGAWSDASRVYAPAADPARDYHGIATAGGYVNLVSGQEILLFTFSVPGGCMAGIRLFENATDPSSNAAGFNGGDYKSYIGDANNFGDDVYGSTYTTSGGLCGTPPTVGFVSPVNGSTTAPTPVISGTATPGSSVTVGEGGTTLCILTASAAGSWSCTSGTPFSTGTHTLTAIAGNSVGVSPIAQTSFTVGNLPTIAIVTPPVGSTTTTTPTISGTATPLASVTVGEGGTTLCTTTASVSGAWTCSGITFPTGPHTVTAVASNSGGSSSPATTTFNVAGPPTIAIVTPPTGTTTTTTPVISGTATPGALVTVGEGGITLCSTTASASGAWSCSGITFPTGPHIVTAVASNGGGNSTPATTNFTSVAPPTIAIVTPPVGSTTTTTPTISGTATPGASVTVGEGGTTLCTTTASVSGSWSCSGITFPTGPHTVTAVASNVGGTSIPAVTAFAVVPNSGTITAGPNSVFNDLNGNCTVETGESLTGLPTPLYAKLINSLTPTVAQQTALVAVDGSYSFVGVPNGTYTIIIDTNSTTSDVTPLVGYTNSSRGLWSVNAGVVTPPATTQFCLQSVCPPFTLPTLSK